MPDVYVCGVGMTRFGKQLERSTSELAQEAVASALAQAELTPADLDEVYFANAIAASITGQEMVPGQVFLRPAGLAELPIFNLENACASASSALHLGTRAVISGMAETVLCIGAEKMSHVDKARPLVAIARATDVAAIFGAEGPQPHGRSWFMDNYAAKAREYMDRSGATAEDFARVAAKNHDNGTRNDKAQYGAAMGVEEVLAGRVIVDPLTLAMCSPVSDGAAAVVLSAAPSYGRPAVRVAASVVTSGSPGEPSTNATRRAARKAYERAGLGPEDLDLVELHDAVAPAEVELYEELGLAAEGEGPRLIRQGVTLRDGSLPVNVSGGLLARGHPIGATGLAQVVEVVTQLQERAGDRQVAGARIGLTHNAGGWLEHDNAVAAVHILERPDGRR